MGLINYIREVKGEMKHVSWPTKHQATSYTIFVIVISLFIAAYLGFFDWVFTSTVDRIIESDVNSFDPAEHIDASLSEDEMKNLIENSIQATTTTGTTSVDTVNVDVN